MKTEESKKQSNIQRLSSVVREQFFRILRSDPSEWKLSKDEVIRFEEGREALREAIRECGYGDQKAKIFILEYMKDLIQKYGEVNEHNIYSIIPFHKPKDLTYREKLLILLELRENEDGKNALSTLIEEYHWNQPKYDSKDSIYEIDGKDLEQAFYQEYREMEYEEKLSVVVQRIYETYLGCGAADRLLDMKLDGVSAGVSNDTKSLWIFFHGTTIHMPCIQFESEQELIRTCRILYRYGSQSQLSQSRGYVTSTRRDGSRVVVMRPPFAESWVFFVRKFDVGLELDLKHILKADRKGSLRLLLKWMIRGCQVTGITGEQGSGKTTLLMALIGFIPTSYTIRVQELTFELQLRNRYPNRNILSLRETETITGQEALDLLKKTDGTVTILGEVATHAVAGWLIQISQTASRFTMFTHHAKTTKDLMESMRNALLQEGGFQNEQVAIKQVASSIRFDIHMIKNGVGERFVERVTEIIPSENGFKLKELITFQNGCYQIKNQISESVQREILKHLNSIERCEFIKDMDSLAQMLEDKGKVLGQEAELKIGGIEQKEGKEKKEIWI